jgi:hypothetical protein
VNGGRFKEVSVLRGRSGWRLVLIGIRSEV